MTLIQYIVVVGEQYNEPPSNDLHFPIPADLVNYTNNTNTLTITIPSSLVEERLWEMGDNGKLKFSLMLILSC